MAFRYLYNSSGGDPVIESFPLAAVTTVNNTLLYYNGAGFISNVYVNADTISTVVVAGVAAGAVVNAAGGAGDLQQPMICTKDARYSGDAGVVEQTDIGTNVSMDSVTLIDEDDPLTTSSGVIRLLKVIGTAGTATTALCSINFGTP